ncbi:MAG: helix-turn-helix transcriptional regulator [Devosia sp.]|uniref:helix-turn-helix transcriptional regulator n=1 Tax=Devosia sp. TaxID=1871048 RepID=UPI0024C6E4D6|nr:helix-turn-helix transcriptional regulator [Devosia sp.]UYN99835.1 MAG: helix-turn-helix transcriptional regulator [Devosia sp.]
MFNTALATDPGIPSVHHNDAGPVLTLVVDAHLHVEGGRPDACIELGPLGIVFGKVTLRSAQLDAELSVHVRSGLSARMTLPRLGMDLTVLPVTVPGERTGGRAVILLQKRDVAPDPLVQIRSRCGLTGAETDVLHLIFKGLNTVEVASALKVAKSTVRTHLQHIFQKTDTSRQSELVHFVATFAAG